MALSDVPWGDTNLPMVKWFSRKRKISTLELMEAQTPREEILQDIYFRMEEEIYEVMAEEGFVSTFRVRRRWYDLDPESAVFAYDVLGVQKLPS
jgi:hypothetical protein